MNNKKFKYLYYVGIFFYLVAFDFCLTNIYKYSKNYMLGDLRIKHPIYHHELKKNSEGGGSISEKYYSNSLGFRDFSKKDISIETDKKRILLMGDSSTMGLNNEYSKSFSGKITKYFEKKNIEVLNGGATSYSPTIYFTKIKFLIEEKKLKFDELYLFIDISDTFDDVYRYKLDAKGNVIDADEKVKEISYINFLKIFIGNNFTFFFIILDYVNDFFSPDLSNDKFAINHQNNLWNITEEDYELYGKRGLKKNIEFLNKIKKLLDKNNIKMKVFIYPWPGTIYYYTGNTVYEKTWENWAAQNEVPIYNYVKEFEYIKDLNLDVTERLKIIDKHFKKLDMHFNENGNLLFFNKIVNFIEK